jgi:hypothetical protein
LTGEYGNFRRHTRAATHERREFLGDGLPAYGTLVYTGGLCRDRSRVPVAPGEPATAAIGAGQTVSHLPRQGIDGYREDFFEESKRKTQNKSQNKSEYCGYYDYHITILTSPTLRNQ